MLSFDAYRTILGIEEKVKITDEEMADSLNLTFFPFSNAQSVNESTLQFVEELKKVFIELGVNVVPYEEALERVTLGRRFARALKIIAHDILFFIDWISRKENPRIYINAAVLKNLVRKMRVKKGISIIAAGENDMGNLPMDSTSSFRESSVITIIDWPKHITEASEFEQHFDTAMSLFAHHMTNIVLAASEEKWLLYNFNASHPVYERGKSLKRNVLHALIPKIAAPIRPLRLKQFEILKDQFDPFDSVHAPFVKDLIDGSKRFQETNLYPPGKRIDDLPFRNDFYRWIGKIHLDERSGMSFGFLAHQMPSSVSKPMTLEEAKKHFGSEILRDRDYFFDTNGGLYVLIDCFDEFLCVKVPEVWVLSQRSGSNKTNMNPQKDLVKLGLKNGKMYLQTPQGLTLTSDYKTSFDTQVILAHSVGNALLASLLSYKDEHHPFLSQIEQKGAGIAHWHGYFRPDKLPKGWFLHGTKNPHVSCSSPQSAIYAIHGKLQAYNERQEGKTEPIEYKGDIHIEPHHGTNIVFASITELVDYLLADKECASLGNRYLSQYSPE